MFDKVIQRPKRINLFDKELLYLCVLFKWRRTNLTCYRCPLLLAGQHNQTCTHHTTTSTFARNTKQLEGERWVDVFILHINRIYKVLFSRIFTAHSLQKDALSCCVAVTLLSLHIVREFCCTDTVRCWCRCPFVVSWVRVDTRAQRHLQRVLFGPRPSGQSVLLRN